MTQDAYYQAIETYYRRLTFFVQDIIKDADEAKDVVQDIFVKLWDHRDAFTDDMTKIKAFLYISCRNRSVNLLKHIRVTEKTRQSVIDQYPQIYIPSYGESLMETALIKAELLALLYESAEQLPRRSKAIFKLYYEQGIQGMQIARMMNLSISSVRTQLGRARDFLRARFTLGETLEESILRPSMKPLGRPKKQLP